MSTTRATADVERQALAALRRMRERLEAVEASRIEPLAVVGLGCRMPGAPDPAAFWDLLQRGGDAIGDIGDERWDIDRFSRPSSSSDRTIVHKAGLLDRVDLFDAEFFGIAGREAQLLDPQQRLFLEVVWEALEHAGIPALGLRGSRTGVFVGTTTTDYLQLLTRRLPSSELDAYIVSGNTINATAGRVSYVLGLHGPSIAMDTACSSSLVAVDRACRSLRDGECNLAIAGGVNLILAPELLVALARWGMLAPDGRCKTAASCCSSACPMPAGTAIASVH
jgi:acyl transferase domain-containing protein